ncbi:hypothetical protein B0T25DRAFT_362418 [Lasiosphaeria hispida]|uniref:Mannosyl-3-phosphoglycerate synthase n=1 Tax=Lasiosphaeria hispida TaxID=260671 RepID=A0AAJ0H5M3_9PEZI|nr:hypothetical protein B0T25DRAFT_362418 [Lasiosphaeria hispida]
MRVSRPRESLTVGNLSIMHEIKVMELDGGEAAGVHAAPALGPWRPFPSIPAWPSFLSRTPDPSTLEKAKETADTSAVSISHAVLDKILAQMVIIVPCMDESPEIIEGVLSGIPHSCLIIIVSNSTRKPSNDGYQAEVEMLRNFCGSRRQALAVHQKDPGVAAAIKATGMPELIGADGTIRKGKGEGMILGLILAAALCPERKYVGFVDADNQVPGAVHEYCRTYASGFALYPSSEDQHIMVRLRWASKPKARGDTIVFEPEGRSSHIVNNWLNQVLSPIADTATSDRVVVTGNAGEHAMTMCLALKLMLAGGYAIEPFHFIDLLSRQLPSLSAVPSSASSVASYNSDADAASTSSSRASDNSLEASHVRILQIRTRNPHIHRPSDDSHISAMWKVGLGTIYYHSRELSSLEDLVQPGEPRDGGITTMCEKMLEFVDEHDSSQTSRDPAADGAHEKEPLPAPRIYPPIERLDLAALGDALEHGGVADSLKQFGLEAGWASSRALERPPVGAGLARVGTAVARFLYLRLRAFLGL